jgi:curved DNA-binding protein CbpA
MQGKIREHPLAELIREVTAAGLSGALRLERERARVAIYFEAGKLVFATSNLRAHRLREVVKRNGLTAAHLNEFQSSATDEELAAAMLERRLLQPETLAAIRVNQVGDVLRTSLLWTEGAWEFDQRVRLADEIRVDISVKRLLLECARHLPVSFVLSRLEQTSGTYSKDEGSNPTNLLPAESIILSRAYGTMDLDEAAALNGEGRENAYRAIYALALSGFLLRSNWPLALTTAVPKAAAKSPRKVRSPVSEPAVVASDDLADLETLFARLDVAKDHYEVIDVGRLATIDEIKNAYHSLARRFHPDRFHQSEAELRTRVESAFARIAHAYETLSDQSLRAGYDAKRSSRTGTGAPKSSTQPANPNGAKEVPVRPESTRAETSFQNGLEALKRNRHDEGVRYLAEAAMLSPREARYRAHYGHELIRQPNMRRVAETELQAAVALEPENSSYRVMLAELYKQLGLHRRAEGELERALTVDPKNQAARSLLQSLKTRKS